MIAPEMSAMDLSLTKTKTGDANSNSLPTLGQLLEQRLAIVGMLAASLEASRWAIGRKDAEAIARGAARQAELCRQWSELEEELRAKATPSAIQRASGPSPLANRSAELAAQWEGISARLRYLTRVHCSLLGHMQRSLGVLNHLIDRCAPTYVASIAGGGGQPSLSRLNPTLGGDAALNSVHMKPAPGD